MKKFLIYLFIIAFTFSVSFFSLPVKAEAKTLNDLYEELKELERKAASNESNKKNVNSKIAANEQAIVKAGKDIDTANENIENNRNEILRLEEEKKVKREQIKELLKYYQAKQTVNEEIDYVADGSSIVDSIARKNNIELLTEKNNQMILDFIDIQSNLETENKKLDSEILRLEKLEVDLAKQIKEYDLDLELLYEHALDINDQVEEAKKLIKFYEKMGCKKSETFEACRIRVETVVPNSKGFASPLESGYITSNYGWRVLNGRPSFHTGIDMSKHSPTIYAAAAGEVAIVRTVGMGGNAVFIHHYINGKKYTTSYSHMKYPSKLKVGDKVTVDTVVGIVGNTGNSFGAHLHFAIFEGWYGVDHWSYSKTVNPRQFLKYPARYVFWSGRNR